MSNNPNTSDEFEAVPNQIATESSRGYGTVLERITSSESRLTTAEKALRDGARRFGNQETRLEAYQHELSAVRLDLTQKLAELKTSLSNEFDAGDKSVTRKLDAEAEKILREVEKEVQPAVELKKDFIELENKVTPRLSWRILSIGLPVALIVGGWIWFFARTPDRSEQRDLEGRVHAVEMRTTVLEAITPKTAGKP